MNRGDVEAAFAEAHPDVAWTTAPQVPNAGTYRGREAVQGFFQDQRDSFDSFVVEVEETFEKDDQVVAFLTVRVRPRGGNSDFEINIAHLWTIRDGVAVAGEGFPDRRDALEAAQISP